MPIKSDIRKNMCPGCAGLVCLLSCDLCVCNPHIFECSLLVESILGIRSSTGAMVEQFSGPICGNKMLKQKVFDEPCWKLFWKSCCTLDYVGIFTHFSPKCLWMSWISPCQVKSGLVKSTVDKAKTIFSSPWFNLVPVERRIFSQYMVQGLLYVPFFLGGG